MATRRQKQLERKYSSYRRYTATEDVNYATHSSRSAYRSESVTSRTSARGRSSSTEVSTGSETRSLPVYIAIQDYNPEPTDLEAVPLEQGQIVEVLDNKNAASWLVRTKARPPRTGWVPGSYFETPTEYYKQRRRTRELASGNLQMTDEQEAIMKRDQVYHDLLRTEEDFVTDLSSVLENYVRMIEDPTAPPAVQQNKNDLIVNLRELFNFHANVMLKGLQYYSDDPGKVGHTFIRLERDFDHHVHFYRQAPKTLKLIEDNQEIKDYLQNLSDKVEAGAKGYPDYLRQIGERVKQYADFFKEIIKYSARAGTSTKSMQKALELIQGIPKRADECVYTDNIENYPGDRNRLGKIYRHDLFQVWEGDEPPQDRYIFLFKNKLMITEKDNKPDPPVYTHYATIRLDKYTARVHTADEDTIVLRPNDQGLPSFRIKAKDLQSAEFVRKAWLKDINEMQDEYLASHPDAYSVTGTEFDASMSDVRSEFSEYSSFSRKSSTHTSGPEEGPARKKIKSPPGISPTGSSTSLYSGGSSIDWTTTGTTLEMQGTRVTRTQYGFRTLQESSAKMCLKVTGYPLPDITWYKDDELLKEDERHTFYADEDGFFAMTIDPVQVTDTGRYTCVATNEYGQASTSAFFRVLKVEKEAAPPAFVFNLKDQEVKEGEVVSFECEVEGWPEPELVWLVDDQPLRPSHDFRLQYDGQKAKLEIRDAQPEDTGNYSVKITNEYGSLESAAKLVVQPDPDKNHVPPDFQAMIEDVECNEGDTVKFKAVITGDPDPEITWIINGIPLTESEKIKFISEDGICILTIKDVSRHFDGTVTCQGKNRLGTANCDAKLRVKVPPAAPSFEKPLEDRVITEKNAVMFECIVAGYPDPKVEFLLNGRPLISGQDGVEIIQRDGNYRLTINNTSIEKHDGILTAKAVNEHGSAESRAKLSVEAEEEDSRSAPTFIKDIDDKTVKFGEQAKFVTTVRGNPNPTVSWFINGHILDSSTPGVVIEANGADHSLTIDSSKHAGTILCRAENSIGRFETKARLIVLPVEKSKKAPEFVEKLQDKSETEGGTVVFEARVDAEPRAQFKWTLNGEELKENNRIHFREFDGSVKLEISDITLAESGTLKCTATNSEGESSSEAKFTVNKKPSKPVFESKPKNVSVERGQEAVFTCKVDGAPKPEITWAVGGRKVKPGADFARVETLDDGTSKLIVDTNKVFENATVTVTAENSQGVDETGALLNVEQPKEMAVIRDLKDTTVERGNLAHFEAVILNAKTVQWVVNGNNVNPGDQGVTISQDDKFEFRLTLDTNNFKSSNNVSIKASNNVETIEKKALLIITEKPREEDKPQFTDQLKDINAELGKPLTIDVIALNEPKFKWFLNGQELVDGQDGVSITNDGNKSTLKIDQVKPEHAGQLSVSAENAAGKNESSAKIAVTPAKSAAKITESPKSVSVNEKESCEFTTKISGFPEPTIKWSINDRVIERSEDNIQISQTSTESTLRINQVTASQDGKVKIEVSNSEGSDSATADLKVKPSETKPKFTATLSDAKVAEGEPLSFNVSLENASPNTKVNWYLNGKKLEASDKVKIVDNGNGNYKLEISAATPDMNGELTVRAENSQGSDESKAKIEVTTGERKPEFSKTPQDHDVEEDTSVKFSAIITGVPEPEITWFLNDVPIVSNEDIRVKRDAETGKTSIRIFKPKQNQTGKVKVKATNKLGTIESTAELKVCQKKEIPHFLTELSDRQVNEGSDVKFQAKIQGFPEPEVEWTLNGQPIKADNVKTSKSGDLYVIEFNKVQLDQQGELAVEAKNSIGTKKENCTLAVKETGVAPNFTMNLTDRLVEENQTVVMEAQLNKEVKPKPTIEWFKDGTALTDSRYKTSYDESNGILKLTIAQAIPDDKSRITIKAENKWGSSETSASIGVTKRRPMAKPQFLSELAPIQITEGDSLNAKVIITGDPKPIAKWYVNDQLVAQTEDTELKEENGVYSMTIHGCTTDMTGKIKVVAVNRMGEVSTEGKLTVIAPVPVEFETCLCDATCREGDTLKLKAVLLGEPTPTVTWYVNGKKLEESQNIKIHADKGTYTVTIKDITTDYSGKVVCEAVNEFGKASSEATLIVLPRGEPPDFIEWLSNIRARQGSQVVHKVVFTGDPKPTLTWYINNKEVKDGLEGITIKTDDKTSVLTIKNFNPDKHVGEIICKAENDAGEVSCTANMVTYTSDMISESESEAMAEDVGITDDLTEIGSDVDSAREEITRTPTPVMAPKFITKIKDTRANKGHQAIFECVVPDTKGIVCKWLKDGKELELIARIRVQTRTIEGHVTNELIIDDVQPEDAGKYTVVVENTHGQVVSEANLTVLESLDKPQQKAPEFTVNLKDKQATTDERVSFECKVVGEPSPQVKWYKDEQQIFEETKKIIIESDEGVQRLVIEKAQTKDTGVYKCVAENTAGKSSTDAKLEVRDGDGKPEIVNGLKPVSVKPGERAAFEVETKGPVKQVKWYKNGEELKDAQTEEFNGKKFRLIIPSAKAEDAGNYKVVVVNDSGAADSSAPLTVSGGAPIKFVKPLQDVTADKGSDVPLEVELDRPPKDLKWYKNGNEIKPGDKEQPKKISDTKYQLLVPDVDADGQFKVVATSDEGVPSDSSCALTVKLPSEPKLQFLKPLKDTEVVEGEKAEFEVETNAQPRSVKWYKNGNEIKPSDAHFEIKQVGDTKYRLVIPKADKNDAGTFKVVLENAAGPVDSSANLTVKTGAKNPPKITKGLEDTAVAKGDALIFEVKIDGDVDTVKWLKDGQPVEKANANAKIEKVDNNTYRLTIPKTDTSDAGQYTVEATNAGGKASSSASGEVDEKPEIVKGLVPEKVDEGEDVTFKVEVSAPVREVKWFKNGQEIKPGAHFQPKQVSPKKFELTINKAQLDDGATYKVVLGNKAGSCDSSADLQVSKPNVLKLVKGLSDVDVDEGQPLVLSCKIEGTPKSVQWFKNGKEVAPDERIKLQANPNTGEYSLSIDSSVPSDGAAYRVLFTNEKGDLQSGAVAHVKAGKKKNEEATAPTFVTPLADVDIEEGDTLTLKCKIGGVPQPEVKWYRNGEELKPSDRVTIRLAMDGTATLRILDSKKSDAGSYKVVAKNPAGEVDSSCKVGVLSPDEMPCAPKFIIPLRSTDAPLGAKAEFNIKVRGVPKPELRFQVDGKNLPIDGNRVTLEDMHDGNWCLTIRDLKEEDFGTIRCVAENPHGKDECECKFEQTGSRGPKARDEEGYPPKFNVPLWDRRIPEGQLMAIECHVDAKPLAEITWTFNGDELKPAQGIQIENTPEGACRVKIPEFTQKHVGSYKCFAKNEYGTADTIANLNVEIPKEEEVEEKIQYPPKFNPGLEDKNLKEGDTLSLSCKVDAIPTALITWYKDGLPVKASDRLKWTYDPSTGEVTLTVSDVRDGDDGAYRCVASNHLGATNTACMVSVKTKKEEVKKQGEEPFFTKGLVDQYVDRGQTIELHCAVTGDPMPEIKWYRNGILLRPSARVSIQNTPDGNCKLTVTDVTMSDEGMYRCEAENPHGRAKTQCTAHVQMTIKREKTPIIEGEMPKFIVPLDDASVRPGGLIELECKVTGVPMPTLKWSKDGQPLLEDSRFEWDTQPEKGTYRLTIKNATVHDEGTYRAVATNESGSANTKAMIRIDDGLFGAKAPASTSPRITARLADVRVAEGQPLRLECKVEGEPTPEVIWYKDGERVYPSDRVQIETAPDGTSRLVIPKATMDDDGLYRIIATNSAGSAVDKCTATVRRAPKGLDEASRVSPSRTFDASKAPRCMVPLDNVRVPEGQPFKLRCKFVGDPKPTIKWFKDGERIYSYDRMKLVEHDDGSCELVVDSASKSDAGMYRCVAENDFGSARTTGEVTVQLKDRTKRNLDDQLREGNAPGFSIPLVMKRARPGETVTFECLPYGKPFPTIKWLKDGIELLPGDGITIEALPDGTQKLTVENVDFLREGYYRCVATNEHGTASTKAELTVTGERRPINGAEAANGGPPEESKPRIRRGLYPMSIHQGSPVEMQVVATGWPTPTVKWFKNGEEIKSDVGEEARRTIWTDERGIHHCIIINVQPEDEGDYSVVATNPLGEAKTEGPLSVIRPRYPLEGGDEHGMPFPPGFIRQLKNKHVFTHMPTIFDCLVVGYPPPTVDWYHNGKKIVPDGRTKIQVAGGGSHALLIMDTTLEDAGEYVAIARNSHGTAQSSAILDVTVPHLDNIKFDGSFDVTPYLTEEYGFKKLNYKCLPTPPDRGPFIKEVTGHYLTLSWIPTKRTPPRYPQVTYVIEIRELPDRDWTLLDYNIPEPVCKVRNLELGKSYQFRVRAENIYGISDPSPASPPSRLMAPPPPVLDKNKKIIPLLDPYTEKYLDQAYAEQYACAPWFAPGVVDKRYCAETDTITVALSFSGYPDPKIQWKFRGWDVDITSPTSNIKVHNYGGAETILTISGFQKENAGQYQCFATNQYGEAQQNIMIELAERPRFIQPLLDKTFSDGKPMKLDVRVEGSPFPELKWMKDWKPIVESHRIKFVQDGPYLCSMIINNPIWRDSGIYSVIAINDAGQSTTSCTVTVEADGEYNDVQLPRKRVNLETRKVKDVYEIDSSEEK